MKSIDKEQLEAFLKLKIPMASVCHVSRPTLFIPIRNFNIDNQRFSPLSDPEIRQAVEVIASNLISFKSQGRYSQYQPSWPFITC